MKENTLFIGIDVSKLTLDLCLQLPGGATNHQIRNTVKSIGAFFRKIMKVNKEAKLVVCMENTGYYNWPCYEVFEQMNIELYVVNALHLKRSLGLVRGKSDTIDASRIMKFITIHYPELKATKIARRQLRELQALVAQRNRLIETKRRLEVPCHELSFMTNKTFADKAKKSTQKLIKVLEEQVKEIEKDINGLISADPELYESYNYITSVQGVGKVLAWTILIKTNEFKSINDPKKLACYAGVVPFEYSSGSSIYKKPRVSNMADKALKKLLHLSAMRAVRLKGELQDYYQRKVAEGKNKMLVLNAIRNKIVARICSVVNNKKMYQINLQVS